MARVPSLSINVETQQWHCHAGCGHGNLTTLVALLKNIDTHEAHARIQSGDVNMPARGSRDVYIRVTDDRASGSKAEIERHLRAAEHLRDEGMSPVATQRILADTFGISRTTSWRVCAVVWGNPSAQVTVKDGVRLNVRLQHVWKRIRQSCAEHLAALRASRAAWYRSRTRLQDENLKQSERGSRITTMTEMIQSARDWLNTPAPPQIPSRKEWTTQFVNEMSAFGTPAFVPRAA